MKTLLLSVAIATFLSSTCVNAAPPKKASRSAPATAAKPLPVFDFLGQNTESITTMTSLNGTACSGSVQEKFECRDFNDPKIGGVTLSFIDMTFYQGKLYMLIGSAGRYSFGDLLGAFSSKYGAPAMKTEKWQNRAGAQLDNSVAVWKFKGGNLELKSIGSSLNDVDFTFISAINSPPAAAAKVDF